MCVATCLKHLQCNRTTSRESLLFMGIMSTCQQPKRTSTHGLPMFVRMLHANLCMWEARRMFVEGGQIPKKHAKMESLAILDCTNTS